VKLTGEDLADPALVDTEMRGNVMLQMTAPAPPPHLDGIVEHKFPARFLRVESHMALLKRAGAGLTMTG